MNFCTLVTLHLYIRYIKQNYKNAQLGSIKFSPYVKHKYTSNEKQRHHQHWHWTSVIKRKCDLIKKILLALMGMRWIKMSRKMLQNLAYFRNKKTQVVFFFILSNFGYAIVRRWPWFQSLTIFLIPKICQTFSLSTNLDFSSYTLFKIVG